MGTNFWIYSLGDAAFLNAVLNAVAAIPQGTYMTLGGLGAIIGLFMMGVKGATEGDLMKAGFQGLLVSGVLFWVMFIPRADRVVVVDMAPTQTSQKMYVVDNVPLGFAIIGTTTSRIGVFLARLFDQSFSDVSGERVMNGGVGDNLRRITSLRHLSDETFVQSAGGGIERFRNNIARYMSHCTMTGLTSGEIPQGRTKSFGRGPGQDLNKDGTINALDNITYAHRTLETTLINEAGETVKMSCEEGSKQMMGASGLTPASMRAEFDKVAVDGMKSGDVVDAMERFGIAKGAEAMQAAMVAQILASATRQAAVSGGSTQGGAMAAMMVEEASARRNVQFAGEQNMFLRTMRTTIGFFEAVFYALGPIMALLIMVGPAGLAIAAKYVLLTVWVLLWYPMVAIINLYGNVKMASMVSSMAEGGDFLSSPSGVHQLIIVAQDQLGSIAALIAATPVLAMSLIYGGAVAMSAVSGRLAGADQINEGYVAPTGLETKQAMTAGPIASSNVASGVGTDGMSQPKIDVGRSLGEAKTSGINQAVQAQEGFNSTLTNMFSSGSAYSKAWGSDSDSARTRALDSGIDNAIQFGKSQGLDVAATNAFRESQSQEQRTAFDMALAGKLGIPGAIGGGGSIGVSSSSTEAYAKLSEEGKQVVDKFGRTFGENLGMKAAAMDGVRTSVSDSLSERGETRLAADASQALGKSVGEVRSVTETVGTATSAAAAIATSQSLDAGTFVQNWKRDAEANFGNFGGQVSTALANLPPELRDEYEGVLKNFEAGKNGFSGSPVEMQAAALALTYSTHADTQNPEHTAGLVDVLARGSGLGAGSYSGTVNAGVGERVGSQTEGVLSAADRVVEDSAGLTKPVVSAEGVSALVNGGFAGAGAAIKGANDEISAGRGAIAAAGAPFGVSAESIVSGDMGSATTQAREHLSARSTNAGGALDLIKGIELGQIESAVRAEYGEAANARTGYAWNTLSDTMSSNSAIALDPATPQIQRDAAILNVAEAEASRSYLPQGSAGFGFFMEEKGLYTPGDEAGSTSALATWRSDNPMPAATFNSNTIWNERSLTANAERAGMPYSQELGAKVNDLMSR